MTHNTVPSRVIDILELFCGWWSEGCCEDESWRTLIFSLKHGCLYGSNVTVQLSIKQVNLLNWDRNCARLKNWVHVHKPKNMKRASDTVKWIPLQVSLTVILQQETRIPGQASQPIDSKVANHFEASILLNKLRYRKTLSVFEPHCIYTTQIVPVF